jgi:predicted lipid-binding transport protein (Tim44 family)
VVYSRTKVIDIFIERDGMTAEEAEEFAEYNTFAAMVGEKTPLWVEDFFWYY